MAIPLTNVNYNSNKINSFYDTTFTEFIPSTSTGSTLVYPQEAIDKIDSITSQNSQLQNQLNTLILTSELDSNSADIQTIKNIIIGLRIQLGQGKLSTDFNNTFPYSPIPIDQKDNSPSS